MTPPFFTGNETTWTVNRFLLRFLEFDRTEKLQDGDTKISMMDVFLAEVMSDFDAAFPYRNPDTDPATLSVEEKKLQCKQV
ncbi:hypothetical protein FRC11_006732, partial [Ceratobasidium sp. 423]